VGCREQTPSRGSRHTSPFMDHGREPAASKVEAPRCVGFREALSRAKSSHLIMVGPLASLPKRRLTGVLTSLASNIPRSPRALRVVSGNRLG